MPASFWEIITYARRLVQKGQSLRWDYESDMRFFSMVLFVSCMIAVRGQVDAKRGQNPLRLLVVGVHELPREGRGSGRNFGFFLQSLYHNCSGRNFTLGRHLRLLPVVEVGVTAVVLVVGVHELPRRGRGRGRNLGILWTVR